jgi:CHAD domain-containing protein
MRVATRRMRAAVRLFKPALKPKALKPYRAGLRATARALGNVRDLDVLLSNLRAYRAERPKKQREALAPLIEGWQLQHNHWHDELIAYLNGEAYRSFVEAFGQFLAVPLDATAAHDPLDLSETDEAPEAVDSVLTQVRFAAGDLIWHRYSVVRAYGSAVKTASIEELHALRIEAKNFRYTLEFFSEVLEPGARTLIERVIALQDHLGALNDAGVAAERARDFLESEAQSLRPAHRRAIEAYVVAREQEVRTLVEGAPQAWHDVGGTDFRRGLALALANL